MCLKEFNLKNMSTTIIAVVINMLSIILPLVGVSIGSAALTTTVQTLFAIGTGFWIWKERKARGDVDWLGRRK